MIAASLEQVALAKAHSPRTTHAAGTGFVEANDNTLPLRIVIHSVLRLAGRLALAQLRAIYQSGRTVSRSFSPNSFLVCQRIPRAVTKIASAYFVPPVSGHQCLRAVDFDLTAIGEAVVPQLLGGSRDRAGL